MTEHSTTDAFNLPEPIGAESSQVHNSYYHNQNLLIALWDQGFAFEPQQLKVVLHLGDTLYPALIQQKKDNYFFELSAENPITHALMPMSASAIIQSESLSLRAGWPDGIAVETLQVNEESLFLLAQQNFNIVKTMILTGYIAHPAHQNIEYLDNDQWVPATVSSVRRGVGLYIESTDSNEKTLLKDLAILESVRIRESWTADVTAESEVQPTTEPILKEPSSSLHLSETELRSMLNNDDFTTLVRHQKQLLSNASRVYPGIDGQLNQAQRQALHQAFMTFSVPHLKAMKESDQIQFNPSLDEMPMHQLEALTYHVIMADFGIETDLLDMQKLSDQSLILIKSLDETDHLLALSNDTAGKSFSSFDQWLDQKLGKHAQSHQAEPEPMSLDTFASTQNFIDFSQP
jgi:hypothetical protein